MHRLQERRPVASLKTPADARSRRLLILLLVAIAAILVDQVTKSLAVADLRSGPFHLIGPIEFHLEYNSGVAFSIASGSTGPIIVVAVVVVIAVAWFGRRVPTTPAAVAVGLVLGGALGNLSDRLFRAHHGAVVDFIYTKYWPTFNVADSCIVCGCVLLALSFLKNRGPGLDTHEP